MALDSAFSEQSEQSWQVESDAISPSTTSVVPFLPQLGKASSPIGESSRVLSDTLHTEESLSTIDESAAESLGTSANVDLLTGLSASLTVAAAENQSAPDLVAIAFDSLTDHVLGGQTAATLTIENQGTQAAAAFEVDVVYSNDGILGNEDDQVLTTLSLAELAPGKSGSRRVNLQLPIAELNKNALAEDPAGETTGYVSQNKDFLGVVIDPNNAIAETDETNNSNQGKGRDSDDITYFPWDIDGNGVVTPTDAIFAVNRVGEDVNSRNESADFDGNGVITPTDAIAAINRLGYRINPEVSETPFVPTTITSVSPANGKEMVTLTREVIVRFSKKVDPATVNQSSFKVISLGTEVSGRLVVSSTEEFATFFPSEPWNPSTEIRVVIDGDKIIGRDGSALDADKDGFAGGKTTIDFTTLPITRIPDTDVFGYVYDSYNKNPDGSDIPLEGVEIRIDALPEVVAITDENGYFILEDVPAPDFHVYIDGSKVEGVPEGSQYASLGKAFHSIPGKATHLFMDGEDFDIYLPLMAGGDVVQLSPTEDTAVGFGESAQAFLAEEFPDIDPEVWEQTQVTFVAGSAQDEQGNAATQATIVPVNRDRLPAPLPPELDIPLIISIQAGGENGFNREAEGGATNFDVPAPITLPNLSGSLPGTKETIWSFNHDSGAWEIVGSGTVSEDGKTITSDEGVGILAPGWHGVAPGSSGSGGGAGGGAGGSGNNNNNEEECDFLDKVKLGADLAGSVASLVAEFVPISKTAKCLINVGIGVPKVIADLIDVANRAKTNGSVSCVLVGTIRVQVDRTIGLISSCVPGIQVISKLNNLLNKTESILNATADGGALAGCVFAGNKPPSWVGSAKTLAFSIKNLIQRLGGLANPKEQLLSVANKVFAELDQAICSSPSAARQLNLLSSDSNLQAQEVSIEDEEIVLSEETANDLLALADLLQQQISLEEEISDSELEDVLLDVDDTLSFNEDVGALFIDADLGTSGGVSQENIFYKLENLENGFVQRGRLGASGTFENVVFSPNSIYSAEYLNPETLEVAVTSFKTNASGRTTQIPRAIFAEQEAFDVDGDGSIDAILDQDIDGLSDVAEDIVGTSLVLSDTDMDGIQDLAEIEQGLDPLGGQGFPTGIIANLSLSGEAREVIVQGSTTSNGDQTAYVATGSHGLAIIDASQFNNPIIQGQLNLAGDNIDIAVDSTLDIAAVAGQNGGLHLVDVSDLMVPTLIKTVDLAARQVEIVDGVVYAAVGNSIKALDIFSGDEINSTELSGSGFVSDIARDGSTLYTYLSGSDTLSALDISNPGAAVILDELNVSVASSEVGISVGDGIAYIAGSGLRTVDVSDPADFSLIGNADSFFTARDIALNGSGLGLVAAENQGVGVYDLSDPNDTDALFTQIDTSGTTYDIAIASGIAYVADGSSDLQVINYLPFDSQGQAPTISISSDADLDLSEPGIQVLEGASVPIQVSVSDDVQVRNVELLVNGEVVSNDVSFPFDLNAIALSEAPEGTTADIQVRATDTGGNSALSNTLTVNLVPDTFAPEVTSTSPSEGTRRRAISGFSVRFNEPLDETLLTADGITLTNLGENGTSGGGDDTTVEITSFQLSESGRTLFITPPDEENFIAGNYQLRIDSSVISDRAGNTPEDPYILFFTKRSISDPIAFGEIIEDAIFEAGEDQIFTFAGNAGQRIFFDGLGSNFSINARLVSPSGVTISNLSTRSDSNTPISLLENGTYQWVITGSGNTTGDYSFQILDLTTADTLTLDTVISDTLDPGDATRLYQFEGSADQQLFFDGLSDETGSTFYLYGPGNQLIDARDTRFDEEIILPGDGTYVLAIRGFATEAVDYSFELSTPATTTTALTLGNTVNSTISEGGEVDVYTFDGTAGQQLFYDGFNGDFSINVQLLSPSGSPVRNFFNSATTSDRVPVTLLEDGTYQLIVDGSGSTIGDYGFQLTDLATVDILTLDTVTNGTLDPGSAAALYQFEGSADQQLFFDGLSTDSGSTFYLYGPGNQLIDARDTRFDEEITLPGDGTYVLAIRGFSNEVIDYSFELSTPATTTTALTLGNAVNSTISEGGEVDVYTFDGTAGQQLFYDGFNGDFGINVQLLSPSGTTINNFFNSATTSDRNPVTLLENGTYQLIVDGSGSTTGDYGFQLTDLATVDTLTLDTVTSGTLDPGSAAALYQFEGSADQQLFFDGLSTDSGSTFYLYGPGNQQLAARDTRSDQEITLPGDGTYVLAIRGFSNEVIDYSFELSTPDTTTTALTLGNAVNSTISEGGEVDIYTFNGTAGQWLYYDGFNGDSGITVRLVGPSGNNVGDFSSFATTTDRTPVSIIEDGTYQLIVDGNGSTTGDYGFQLTDLATVDALSLDTIITDTLTPGSSATLYQFAGTRGQQLFFDGLSNNSNSSFYLYGPGNQQIAARSTRFDQDITLPGDGVYIVAIRGFSDDPIDYRFELTQRPFEEPEPIVGTPLIFGELTDGDISIADEVDTYLFNGTAGQQLYFDGISGGASIDASLISPSGVTLISLANSDEDRGPISLFEDGEYQLRIDGNGSTTGDYSFRLSDIAAVTELSLDTVINGTLETGQETDLFKFEANAGQRLVIEGLSDAFDGYFSLYAPNNQRLAFVAFTSNGEITLTTAGTYYLAAEGFRDTAVDYSFQVVTPTTSKTALTLGDTVSSTLTELGEVDDYTFSGTTGQRLYLDGIKSGNTTIDTSLISPSGVTLFSFSNAGNNQTPFTLLEDGEYQLRIDGRNNTIGDYSFRLFDLATVTDLSLDTVVNGTLEAGRETDLFKFEANAGQRLVIEGLSDAFDGYFALYAPNNQRLAFVPFTSNDEITLATAGTYYLATEGFRDTTVDYSFQVVTPTTSETALTLGDTVSSTLTELGEVDDYTFNGTAGQQLYFDGISGVSSIDASLISPSGVTLFSFGNVGNNQTPFTLLEDGEYQLRIDGRNSVIGDYSFRLSDLSAVTDLNLDTVTGGTLETGRETDLFKFEANAGQRLVIEGLSDAFDGYFSLYAPNNQRLAFVAFTSNDEITLTTTGTYYLAAEGFRDTAVDYSFQVVTPTTSETALTIGDTVSSTLTELGEVNDYTFNGTAGQRLYFDGISGSTSIDASLISPSGVTLFSFSNVGSNRAPFTLLEDGEYQLRIDGRNSVIGDYSFRLIDTAAATTLPIRNTVVGTLNPGTMSQAFIFEGSKNQNLSFEDLGSRSFGGTFRLYGPGNQSIISSSLGFNFEVILPGEGQYLLLLEGRLDEVVNYRFRVA